MSTPPQPGRRAPSWRLAWMLPAGLALLTGLDAALLLLGLPAPVTTARLPQVHGVLMVIGFVGTLIALERATALDRWYGYLAPAVLGIGALAVLADPVPLVVGQWLLVLGTAAFTAVYYPLWRRQDDEAILTQLLAAGLACAACVLWALGAAFPTVLPWLIGFVVLTIAAERVELARITLGPRAGTRALVHGLSITLALLLGLLLPQTGAILLGLALLALVLWLVRNDVARRTIRTRGATRYMAAAILAGYAWLAVAGVILLFGTPQGAAYDAVAHAVFLGYTISMIMAHATSILPAVLRIALPYRPAFWIPLVIVQLSLLVRLWMGDARGWVSAWQTGGVLGVIALLVFVLTALTSAILGPPRPAGATPRARGFLSRSREDSTAPRAAGGSLLHGRRAGRVIGAVLVATVTIVALSTVLPLPTTGDRAASGASGRTTSSGDAPVRTVAVTAADMRFDPDRIEVPAGTRLVIELTNTDSTMTHDLVVGDTARTDRLAPGASARLDVGVVARDLSAWCSVPGHRQQGMTLEIVATGSEQEAGPTPGTTDNGDTNHTNHGDHEHAGHEDTTSASGDHSSAVDLHASPGEDFTPYDAELDPLPAADGPVTHRVTLPVTEQEMDVAPGVRQRLWTFGGTAPGPVLHGRVGDTFVVTLRNDGTMGHSIDFHAGELAPDRPMRTIDPGESLTYTFTATRSGIWMYHCATDPVSTHIASGMYGAVVIEPEDLPEVDRSYVLVQGEYYLGEQGGEVDADALANGDPDLVVWNGYANQYTHRPLKANVGERVRFWVLDAGPERPTSFHVVGGQFDTVWSEGRYLVDHEKHSGSQALGLLPGQGGFVEMVPTESGHYPFMTHLMVDAERGAHGVLEVDPA